MPNKFGIYKDRDSRFFFSLTGEDGTELMRSLTFFTKGHAHRAARQAKQLLLDDSHLVRLESHGKLYFVLRNERGEQLARSTHVRGPLALEEIVQETRSAAPQALVIDATDLTHSAYV